MNSIFKFSVLILLVLGLCGCLEKGQSDVSEKLAWLMHADPVADANTAIDAADLRLLAVHNHHLKMPLNIESCLVEKLGYRTLSNEDFAYGSYDYQRFGALAQLYANWYNNTILLYLEDSNANQCGPAAQINK
ncbi:hypothetical protein [Alteromonas flava]|uniref:hypothetical protein n=1 Tax=Alteromonas flava TaxID=2048003 RepID=UPI000C29146C|nr:hypothetical protein [Alteromonas flava]